MRVAPSIAGLLILCYSGTAFGQTRFRGGGAFGAGAAMYVLGDVVQPGVGVAGEVHVHHESGFTLRFVGDVTLTDFERTTEWAKAGYDVGEFSVNGFKDVTSWVGRGNENGTTVARALVSIFAYTFLTLTLFISGVLYLGSPLGSITTIHTGVSGGYRHQVGGLTLHGDSGFGHVIFFDPADNKGYSGWAPSLAMGFDLNGLGFGLRAMVSPKSMHHGPDVTMFATTATMQLVF